MLKSPRRKQYSFARRVVGFIIFSLLITPARGEETPVLIFRSYFQFVNTEKLKFDEKKFLGKIRKDKIFEEITQDIESAEILCKLIYLPSGWRFCVFTPYEKEVYSLDLNTRYKRTTGVFRKFYRNVSEHRMDALLAIYKGLIQEYLGHKHLRKAEDYLNRAFASGLSQEKFGDLCSRLVNEKEKIQKFIQEVDGHLQEKEYIQAVKLLEKLVDMAPFRVEFKNKLKVIREEAREFYKHGVNSAIEKEAWNEAAALLNALIEVYPEAGKDKELLLLQRKVSTKIQVTSLIKEGRRLYMLTDYNLALERVNKALQLDPENKEALDLKGQISYQLAERYFMNGQIKEKINPVDALDEYFKAEEFYPGYLGLKENIRGLEARISEKYIKEAQREEGEGLFANAFLKYIAAWVLKEKGEIGGSRVLYDKIKNLVEKIRARARVKIGIGSIKDYARNQQLAIRFVNGLFTYLFNEASDYLEIYDCFSSPQGGKKDIQLLIDGFIYPLEIERNKYLSAEKKKIILAVEKKPNPKRAEIISRLNALGIVRPCVEEKADKSLEELEDTARVFGEILESPAGFSDRYKWEMLGELFRDFKKGYETQYKVNEIVDEINRLEKQLKETPEFIEEPVYGVVEANGETHIKLVHLACGIRIKDVALKKFIFSREFEKFEVASDVFIPGDERLGIKGDPLELPTDLEMKEKLYKRLLQLVNTEVFNYIKDWGLKKYYLNLLNYLRVADLPRGLEESANFIWSISARFYPQNSKRCLALIQMYLKELVGKKLYKEAYSKFQEFLPSEIQSSI